VKKRIYVADDHALVRSGLVQIVDREPDMVVCGQAAEVDTALREIILCRPDQVLVDLSFRHSSGLDLIQAVRRKLPATGILVVSAHEEAAWAPRVAHTGADGYVMKQDPRDIRRAIRRILAGRTSFTPPATHVIEQASCERRGITSVLTDRELAVARGIGAGKSGRQMATQLHVSERVINQCRRSIRRKLHLRDGRELVGFCTEAKLLGLPAAGSGAWLCYRVRKTDRRS
jgi:DNA-binding NarL/FixJ family response regulator